MEGREVAGVFNAACVLCIVIRWVARGLFISTVEPM